MSSWLPFLKSPPDQNPGPRSPPENTPSPAALSKTLGHQLRLAASFLAPPPQPQPHSAAAAEADDLSPRRSSSQAFLGVRNDLAEIGGSLKTTVTGISRFASNLLQFRADGGDDVDGDDDGVGITEEVVEFVGAISSRPEFWTDFPLALRNDFDMSDIQREHAATIEHLVPSFAALRQKVCIYLTEEQFWMIYFILLLPRLNEDDFKLLSTPEIVEVREVLLQRLRDKKINPLGTPEETETVDSSQKGDKLRSTKGVSSPSDAFKLPIQVMNTVEGVETYEHENIEQRSGEEEKDRSTFADARKGPKSESFSDLEDDDNNLSGRLSGFRKAESSCSESNEWVRLSKDVRQRVSQSTSREKDSEGESSNEWLAVDDIDSDSFSGA